MSYIFTAEDTTNIISATAAEAAVKYIIFRNGNVTDYLQSKIDELKAETTVTSHNIPSTIFQVQNWHGGNFHKTEGELGPNISNYFNVLQDSWQSYTLTASDLQSIEDQSIYLGGYHWTHKYTPVLDFLTNNGAKEIFTSCRYNTALNENPSYSSANNRLNPMQGDTIEASVIYALYEIKDVLDKYPITKIMLDSEFRTGIGTLGISFDSDSFAAQDPPNPTDLQGTFTITHNTNTTDPFTVPSYDLTPNAFDDIIAILDDVFIGGDKYYNGMYWNGRGYMNLMYSGALDFDVTINDTNISNGSINKSVPYVTTEVARSDGLSALIPQYPQGSIYYPAHKKVFATSDSTYKGLRWSLQNGNYGVTIRILKNAIQQIWPHIKIYTDPVFDDLSLNHLNYMDVLQTWVESSPTIKQPTDIAMEVLQLHVHKRHNANNPIILAGPQLCYHEDFEYTEHRGIPKDIFTIACWMSFGFGAHMSHWGHSWTINTDTGEYYPNGEDVWDSLQKLKTNIYTPLNDLLVSWTQKTGKRVALWFSAIDQITSGCSHDRFNYIRDNVFRALLTIGEPFDIIYDDEILDNTFSLSDYDAIIVPCSYAIGQDLLDKLHTFHDASKTIITHVDCPINDQAWATNVKVLDGTYHSNGLYPLLPKYTYAALRDRSGLEPHEYYEFIHAVAADIKSKLSFSPKIETNDYDVISNIMTDGTNDYLVLINNNREYGDEVDYWTTNSPDGDPIRYNLDTGVATTATLTLNLGDYSNIILEDMISGENFSNSYEIPLLAGWGRILKINYNGVGISNSSFPLVISAQQQGQIVESSITSLTWQDTMIPLLRQTLDDVSNSDYRYNDTQLEETLISSAYIVANDFTFSNNYQVNLSSMNIIPDPSTIPDQSFIALTVLKAAYLLRHREYNVASNQSFNIKDGSSQISSKSTTSNLRQRAHIADQRYQIAADKYNRGKSLAGELLASPIHYTN